MNNKVSVIMAVYNEENYIIRAVSSIEQQSYKNIELIICDDASTDKTYSILLELAKEYNNIKIIKNDYNKGLAYSLNRCFEMCDGGYVARMDADDYCLPERIEKQLLFLESHPEYDLVGTQYIMVDDIGNRLFSHQLLIPTKNTLPLSVPFAHPTILIRYSSMKKLGGYLVKKYTRRCEDLELWYRFFYFNMKGYNLPYYLYIKKQFYSDYKKRKIRYGIDILYVNLRGLQLIHGKWFMYFYSFKSLISYFVPKKIIIYYHKCKFKNPIL